MRNPSTLFGVTLAELNVELAAEDIAASIHDEGKNGIADILNALGQMIHDDGGGDDSWTAVAEAAAELDEHGTNLVRTLAECAALRVDPKEPHEPIRPESSTEDIVAAAGRVVDNMTYEPVVPMSDAEKRSHRSATRVWRARPEDLEALRAVIGPEDGS